jgi:hypothetical protein
MWWLLAAQAAGMVVDWYGSNQQKEIGRMGTRIEQAGIDSAIQTNRLEAEDASLQAMKQLRQNLGTQAAIMAARGTRSGVGSALALSNESVSNFNADERTRRINLLGKEANLRAQNLMAGLHQLTYETQLGQSLRQRAFDKLPLSTLGGGNSSKSPLSNGTKSFGVNDIKSLQG